MQNPSVKHFFACCNPGCRSSPSESLPLPPLSWHGTGHRAAALALPNRVFPSDSLKLLVPVWGDLVPSVILPQASDAVLICWLCPQRKLIGGGWCWLLPPHSIPKRTSCCWMDQHGNLQGGTYGQEGTRGYKTHLRLG